MTSLEPRCQRCGQPHGFEACPYVKAIEYGEFGHIQRVEFLTPADLATISPPKPEPEAPPDYPRLKPNA